jgi:(R,R)-butanediol dehydrogenase/meso-butanediol dehydrogenase/diacetyl reductase
MELSMKALKWYGRGDLRYEDANEPTPGPKQVKVKINWVGICGSDLHEYLDGPIFISLEKKKPPIILGHEFAGTVAEVGKGVTDFRPRDRVTGDCNCSCGKCYYCLRDFPSHCLSYAAIGFHADGAMAEYLVAPETSLYKIPDSVSDESAALAEPLSVGLHAIRRSKLQVGDKVAIVGAGTIGLSTLMAAKAGGASQVFVLEISSYRTAKALDMGANAVINPKEVNPVEQIRDLTSGLGVDISFDCVGNEISGPLALELTRNVGTTVIVGLSPKPSPNFNFRSIMLSEKTVLGSIGYSGEPNIAIALISNDKVDPNGLITSKVLLKDAVEKGFNELIHNADKQLKILLQP